MGKSSFDENTLKEYFKTMDEVYSSFHEEKLGPGKRNDVIPATTTYQKILEDNFVLQYQSFEIFISESYIPFCIGFLSITDEKTTEQGYPIAWAISRDRYIYYRDLGKGLLREKSEYNKSLDAYSFNYCDLSNISKEKAIREAQKKYEKMIHVSKETFGKSLFDFYFGKHGISLDGVEVTFRLVLKCPWEKDSLVHGEFYKHIYQSIFPKMNDEFSIRLISNSTISD